MPDKLQIDYNGQRREASRVQVTSSNEYFNTYLLEDGTTVKMKTVLVEVLRVEGELDQEGNPVYALKSKNVVSVQRSASPGT